MKITAEISEEQLFEYLRAQISNAQPRSDFQNAPSRLLAWCTYPAGAEWRECRRDSAGRWMSDGCAQTVSWWLPWPADPGAR
jgi:hypothetical protein